MGTRRGRRALVIGGSTGGLFAAGMLRAAGWDADIYERTSDDLAGRGAGIGITSELLEAMKRVGAAIDPSIGAPVKSYRWLGRDGAPRFEHAHGMTASAWARIYRPLRAAFPDAHYHVGRNLVRVADDADGATAIFADGTRIAADLIVAADGALSTIRGQLMPEVQPRYAGYVAWRGMVAERDLPVEVRAAVAGHIVFSFADDEMMLAMLSPGEDEDMRPGRRRLYFIWYRPTAGEAALRDLFTDAAGRDHGVSIPPPLIRPELIAAMKARAGDIFAPPLARVVQAAPMPLLQAISDMESPRLAFGRVALMGDAAFVARPHVAGGISKAALDAAALVAALAAHDDVPAALAAYEASQLEFGRRIVAHARRLGSYIERPDLRDRAGTDGDPLWIMQNYGAPHLLHDPDESAYRFGQPAAPEGDALQQQGR